MKNKIYIVISLILILIGVLINSFVENRYGVGLVEYFTISQPLTEEEKTWIKKHGEITYGGDKNSPPITYIDDDNQYRGITIDYLNSLSIETGLKIHMKPLIWEEALLKLKNKETDISDMFPTAERSKDYLFSTPISKLRGVIVTSNDSDIKNISDLDNKVIAVQKGHYANEFLKNNLKNGRYIYVDDINAALKLLKNGDADAVVGDEAVCSYFIEQNNYKDNMIIVDKALYEKDVTLAISKDNEILLNIINKGIYSLNRNKFMEKLQQKWFGISSTMTYTGYKEVHICKMILSIISIFILITYLYYLISKSLKKVIEDKTNELNRSQNKLQAAFDVSSLIKLIVNYKGEILNGNKSFYDYCNTTQKEIFSKKVYEINDMFKYIWKELKEKNSEESCFEFNYNKKIYKIKVVDIDRLDKSKIKSHKVDKNYDKLITVKDITKERATEKQLLQSQKMAAVGHLAAGVAHEIRNPLGIIRSYTYLLKNEKAKENEEIYKKSIDNIECSVERASKTIDNLLNFSAISGNEIKEINIRKFFLSMLQLEKKTMKQLHIESILISENIKVHTNEESLKHIFINLIGNAVDAMPNGGTITIICIDKGDIIQIDIMDTGMGIDKENIDNIFNPFFTTKNPDKGTGLGMFIVYNELQKLGGNIEITKSEINKGTTFRVEIPTKGDMI